MQRRHAEQGAQCRDGEDGGQEHHRPQRHPAGRRVGRAQAVPEAVVARAVGQHQAHVDQQQAGEGQAPGAGFVGLAQPGQREQAQHGPERHQALEQPPEHRALVQDAGAGRARGAVHLVAASGLGLQHGGAGRVDQQVQRGHVEGQKDQRPAQQHRHQREPGNRQVDGHHIGAGLAQVGKNPPALAHGLDEGGELVVGQHQVGGFAGHVGAALAHGDAHIGLFERGGVVHAVAGHAHDLAPGLQRPHQAQLLRRHHPGEDAHAPLGRQRGLQRGIVQGLDVGAGQHGLCLRRQALQQASLAGDVQRGVGMVAGEHQHADAGAVAFGQRGGHFGAQGVLKADQPQQAKVEIVLALGQAVAFMVCHGHRQHPQALAGQGLHGVQHGLRLFRWQVAQVEDGLGRALGRHPGLERPGRAVGVGGGQQHGRQRVLALGGPVGVQVFGIRQRAQSQGLDADFHGVEGLALAGQ